MIKLVELDVEQYSSPKVVSASLIADSKEEVIAIKDDGSSVLGLGSDYKLSMGSTCLCLNGDFGMLNSSGDWVFW